MKIYFKLFILISFGLFANSHAMAKTLFIDSVNPPPGFQSLANTQHLRVSVFFMGQYAGSHYVSLHQSQLKFDTPSRLLPQLTGVKNNENILQLLSRSFPLNIECYSNTIATLPEFCEELKKEPIYIIYNPQHETVYLYLATAWFEKPGDENTIDFIQPPTSGLSYINKLGAAGSFNSSEPFTSRIYPSTPNYYNLYSNNVLAYRNNSILANASQNNGINNGEHFQIQNLYAQRIVQDKIYASGYIVNPVSPFLQTQTILGGSIKTTLEVIKNAENVLATPLVIFVPQASQVNIFKNEQLIFSQYLEAGYQRINTSGFPDGAYQLAIKTGENNVINRFFSKGAALPPPEVPQFYVIAGYLTNGMILYNNTYNYLPKTLDIPVFQAGYNERISERMALSSNILFSSSQKSFDFGPTFLYGNAFVKTAALMSSKNNYGIYTLFNTQKNRFNISFIFTKIFYQKKKPDYYFLNNLIDNNSASISYTLSDRDLLGIQANYNKSLSQPASYNSGIFYQRQIANYNGTTFFLNAGYNKAIYVGDTYTLGLSVNFSHEKIAGTEALSWQSQTNNSPGNQLALPVVAQGSTVYSHLDEQGIGSSFNEIHSLSSTVSSLAGTYNYTARPGFIASYINYNRIRHSGSSTGYGGNVETELAMNSNAARLNGVDRGNASGIIIQVDTGNSKDTSSKFVLLDANNRKMAIMHANQKVFLSLPAFTDQDYTLVNLSKSDYLIREPTRHITLYPGNIDYYTWQAEKRIIVIGRLLTKPQGDPVGNTWIHDGDNGIYSDSEGNFQLELPQNTTRLAAGNSCQINLPRLNVNQVYLYIGDVPCS